MGNRILEEKKNPGGKVMENNRYAYNDSNQLAEATLCNGRTTRKVCYTYDDRGYLIAEHTEEAREADPYGRQPHTPYKPERQGKNCDHGKNRSLSYYLLVQDKTYTCVKHRCS